MEPNRVNIRFLKRNRNISMDVSGLKGCKVRLANQVRNPTGLKWNFEGKYLNICE